MRIAVLSGKGGTGKTLLSVNMAAMAEKAKYIDCDVEEPNGHLFFKPSQLKTQEVKVKIPLVDQEICNGCRKCVDFCEFNALAYISNKLMIFDEMCHSCGGCKLVCPEDAISEIDKVIGKIEKGVSGNVSVSTGILNTGEASGIPIIDELLKEQAENGEIHIIDSPPGGACSAMESIRDADYCVLVAEPTLFGLHNLNIVYELVQLFDKAHGVVINKTVEGHDLVEKFCRENDIDILEKIPYDKELGTLNSNGLIAARESEKYKEVFSNLLEKVMEEVDHETALNT